MRLGPTKGEVPFTVGLDSINKVASADDKEVRIVRQERLDDLIGDAQPIMIKMDVEGYEEDVLRGAQALLAKPCLKVIELETVTPAIDQMMLSNQYERAYYNPFSRQLAREPVELKSNNSLFIRDWPFVQARLAAAKKIDVLGHSI
jgi:hypothetical protein